MRDMSNKSAKARMSAKVQKFAITPTFAALRNLIQDVPQYTEAWSSAKAALTRRSDSQAQALLQEMKALSDRWDTLETATDNLDENPSKKNREAQAKKRTEIAAELNLLQQRAKRIIRDVERTSKSGKRGPMESVAESAVQTFRNIEAQWKQADALYELVRQEQKTRPGARRIQLAVNKLDKERARIRDASEQLAQEAHEAIRGNEVSEARQRSMQQQAAALRQAVGAWRKNVDALLAQGKAKARRMGNQQLFAQLELAQKMLTNIRPSRPARFGVLDRVGAAYSALTATPADPGSPAYKTSLAAAKKNAAQVVGNYKFMRDKVAARQQSMDKYVQGAIKAINASTNVNDVQHFIEQLEIAVRAMSTILSSVKTPFSRPGAKVTYSRPEEVYIKLNTWVMPSNAAEIDRLAAEAVRLPNFTPKGYTTSLHQLAVEQKKAVKEFLTAWPQADTKQAEALYNRLNVFVTPLNADELARLATQALGMDDFKPRGYAYSLHRVALQVQKDVIKAKASIKFKSGDVVVVPYQGKRVQGTIVGHDPVYRNYVVSIDGGKNIKVAEKDVRKASMSRPGAKAKMAKWTVVMPSIPDAGTRHFDSWEQAKNYVDTKMGGFTALVSVDGKRYALKHALGQWEKYSRPGAKARMAAPSAKSIEINEKIAALLDKGVPIREAVERVMGPGSWETMGSAIYDALRKKQGMSRPSAKDTAAKPSDLEREDVKAGLKLMEKADKAVSDKIRTLIAEGKPQDQAVAIALDMKRRGEI